MKHTKLPWKTKGASIIKGGKDITACTVTFSSDDRLTVSGEEAEANAEFIVKAVNNHERLLYIAKLLTYRGSYEGRPSDTEIHDMAVIAIKQAEGEL